MNRFQLSFRQKLILGIAISIFTVFGTGGMVTGWLIEERLLDQASHQMEVTGQGIQAMVRSLVMNAIKNYLKGISETNLAYVEHVYGRYQKGEISEQQAKDLTETFMLKQKIGSSGYVTAVDVSNGQIRLAVHPSLKGRDISSFAFARQMAQQRNGYLEFEWKNPGDAAPRLKAQWMSFFEPWQWIINAAPFRDEYPQLVDLAGIESELAKVQMQGQGYAFIMNTQGLMLSHPSWKGRNVIGAIDARSGEPFMRRIIDSIRAANAQQRQDSLVGVVRYHIKDPDSDRVFERMMNYRYVPEVDWIVGVVTDLDQLDAPLRIVRNTQWAVMSASLLLALFVVIWAVRPMTRSIDDLATAVEKIDGGNLDTPLPPSGSDEIGRLSSAFSRMAERLARYTDELEQRVAERTAELEEANSKLAELSNTDGLTGLANRRRFDAVLTAEWARASRTGQSLALILLDVDHFKKFNDCYGHQAGDECLRRVARVLQENARRPGDLAARYGGEEFAIIVADSDADGAIRLAQAVRRSVEALAVPHEQTSFGYVTVSIGVIACVHRAGFDVSELLRRADAALYRAKEQGRNRVARAEDVV